MNHEIETSLIPPTVMSSLQITGKAESLAESTLTVGVCESNQMSFHNKYLTKSKNPVEPRSKLSSLEDPTYAIQKIEKLSTK